MYTTGGGQQNNNCRDVFSNHGKHDSREKATMRGLEDHMNKQELILKTASMTERFLGLHLQSVPNATERIARSRLSVYTVETQC